MTDEVLAAVQALATELVSIQVEVSSLNERLEIIDGKIDRCTTIAVALAKKQLIGRHWNAQEGS